MGDSTENQRKLCLDSVVHGYPIYKQVWTTDIEENSANSPKAVASRKCGNVVGYVPRASSLASSIDETHDSSICNTNASHMLP